MNEKLNATHVRWRDGVLSYHIFDVRHRPGVDNGAADGISRQFTGAAKVDADGHKVSVNPDWEARTGLVHDMFAVLAVSDLDKTSAQLRGRFANEPMFLQVIDAIWNLDYAKTVREKRRARHRALGYMIDEGKLWRLGDGKTTRVRPRLKCVSQAEAIVLAREEHATKGHWRRDLIKNQLVDRICSPRLDKSITTAILECG
ncbi:hypothetical protein FIBSPDRAFT_764317 [Athelia psychrophila]|uniref:Reverse transcriptase RNase H-like domain-containing protein n=1 Tax=Athelia psychrophila TaxID=1759441 RepID=A0A167WV32_9AGAM|nr:hypothetical protein FIBSPDRAFT_764317 [Fibularhizoctonia sp. CBS 109695]